MQSVAAYASVDWNGVKEAWQRRGITPSLVYNGVTISGVSGGVRRGSVYVGNLHLQLELGGAGLSIIPILDTNRPSRRFRCRYRSHWHFLWHCR